MTGPARDAAFWRSRPVLVTGATGLLGGWLVKHLVALEADVVCLVRDWVPRSQLLGGGLLSKVSLARGDVRSQSDLERVIGEYEIDTIFHLAAQTIVGIANRNPVSTFETNIQGTWALLEAARRSPKVKQILLASSDKAYGDHEQLPYDEATPLVGRHPYDVSKSCADLIASAYAISYGSPVGILRCGNFYGGGDLNWNRIVPGTIRSALRGERPVVRSNGRMQRDYVYVEDGVSAYLTLAEAMASRPELNGEAFNFGHDRPYTVLDIVAETLSACGRSDLVPDVRNEATNEIEHQYLDPSKAARVLGWKPAFTLSAGMKETLDWYRPFLAGV
ncbi:MAG: NAD-dependent epimerase/dehydratase family protein [Myxococcales bacterium]|nr:NAD-dependent epimerase/dehydratase family protein [Myxococcales bacterium]